MSPIACIFFQVSQNLWNIVLALSFCHFSFLFHGYFFLLLLFFCWGSVVFRIFSWGISQYIDPCLHLLRDAAHVEKVAQIRVLLDVLGDECEQAGGGRRLCRRLQPGANPLLPEDSVYDPVHYSIRLRRKQWRQNIVEDVSISDSYLVYILSGILEVHRKKYVPTISFLKNFIICQYCGSGFMGSLNPYRLRNPKPGSGSRRAKMTHKKRIKVNKFPFLSAGCSLLSAEGFFSCSFDLYESLEISKLQFLINKKNL